MPTTSTGRNPEIGIARANLDGTGVNGRFVTGTDPWGLTVDASHVYWTDGGSSYPYSDAGIGRANLDGSGVDQNFINSPRYRPSDVAVDSSMSTGRRRLQRHDRPGEP